MTVHPEGHPPSLNGHLSGPGRRLLQVLACSALGPGLDGVLLFDLEPELVTPVTDAFVQVLRLRDGRPVRPTMLGSVTGDDELWLRPMLRQDGAEMHFSLTPGPLADTGTDTSTLVVVPDLVRLSLPGMRAAVQLLGADVASVERSGFRAIWRPRARWLAMCREAEVGRLSPHLLDRFPIRLNAAGLVPERMLDVRDEMRQEFAGSDRPLTSPGLDELPESWRAVLTARERPACPLTEEAAARAVELFDADTGGRRVLGLARLARTLAVFGGDASCGADRVDEAARLIGVAARPVPPASSGEPADGGPVVSAADGEERPLPEPPRPGPMAEETGASGQSIGATVAGPTGPAEALDTFAADTGEVGSPFPEDDARFLREFAPLRIPWQRRPQPSSARGPVIGVQPATDLRDLAFMATAAEAAKHQNLPGRRDQRARQGNDRLVVRRDDLRSHTRLPMAERMLALLLDHTCRHDWDWGQALTPYLQWAYTGRASVCVVEVGSGDAVSDVRAEHFIARSVLDPRVGFALRRPAGRSSPLAHGLALTDRLLRRAFQQRSNLVEAWLVVVTDGRGNVPLDIAGGRPRGPVRRMGVEDALAAAERIGAMARIRLHSVVVDAARQPYPDLTFQLADALGGVTVAGRTAEGVTDAR
ncbi:magnesium chelatase [Streptomyces sp. NBC_00124]|uniref:magnesium chelatase n=1 Tax=Streptomyces sp. NBC_00124 TaxID=2975662 RepID=UPI00225BE13C|nr:magnesium chelatase [Streptomyces sp. NBC_00124]MCX5360046.1 magnesium chelatase [Streptomyces sp. NBC_00124]